MPMHLKKNKIFIAKAGIIIFVLFASPLFGDYNIPDDRGADTKEDSDNIDETKRDDYTQKARKSQGAVQVRVKGKRANDQKGTIKDDYLDSVIYVDITKKNTLGQPYIQYSTTGENIEILASPATALAEEAGKMELAMQKIAEAEANKTKEIPRYYGGGYCRMVTPVSISKSSEFSTLSCLIDFGKNNYRKVDIFTGIYPDYEREMLVALPVYATFQDGKRANVSGVVMKQDRSSVNIADYVDNRRMRKLIGEAGLATNDIAYRYSVAFMTALQASKIKQEVQYVSTVDPNTGNTVPVPIATTNIEPPRATDFFVAAGIELTSKLFAIGAKDYLYNSDPLFKVYSGKRVWLEGIFEFDNKGIAKRFGNITTSEMRTIDKNNVTWKSRRDNTINQYGKNQGSSSGLENVISRQR